MAIRECPKCGRRVSDTAKACPHCGYDMRGKRRGAKRGGRRVWIIAVAVLVVAALAVGVIFLLPEKGKKLNVGDTVLFGHYEQDGDTSDGTEPISWTVLDVQDGKALLLSDKVLDSKQYNEERVDITWETCTLRTWLNGEFMDAVFSEEEKSVIALMRVVNQNNAIYGTDGGNDTDDQIFLLSLNDVQEYYTLQELPAYDYVPGASDKLICSGTEQAISNYLWTDTITERNIADWKKNYGLEYPQELLGTEACLWWLRSPGSNRDYAAYVDRSGRVCSDGNHVSNALSGVRPALWISLDMIP